VVLSDETLKQAVAGKTRMTAPAGLPKAEVLVPWAALAE
jgi:hypothetical protein